MKQTLSRTKVRIYQLLLTSQQRGMTKGGFHIESIPNLKKCEQLRRIGDKMKNKDIRDLIGGIVLIVIGLFAAIHAQQYELGQLQRMGPGYFPTALGLLLAVLGGFVAVPALFREGTRVKIEWKSLLWVTASILVFAVFLNMLGLVITAILTILAASMASDLTWRGRFILSGCVALITYAIFSFGLGMLIPIWPWSY